MLSQTRPRSVRRIRANRSRWPTQYMPARTKLITKAISDGRRRQRLVQRVALGELGDVDLQHQQGDDDREHAVGQGQDPGRVVQTLGQLPARVDILSGSSRRDLWLVGHRNLLSGSAQGPRTTQRNPS